LSAIPLGNPFQNGVRLQSLEIGEESASFVQGTVLPIVLVSPKKHQENVWNHWAIETQWRSSELIADLPDDINELAEKIKAWCQARPEIYNDLNAALSPSMGAGNQGINSSSQEARDLKSDAGKYYTTGFSSTRATGTRLSDFNR
jgi:hypothetical protein